MNLTSYHESPKQSFLLTYQPLPRLCTSERALGADDQDASHFNLKCRKKTWISTSYLEVKNLDHFGSISTSINLSWRKTLYCWMHITTCRPHHTTTSKRNPGSTSPCLQLFNARRSQPKGWIAVKDVRALTLRIDNELFGPSWCQLQQGTVFCFSFMLRFLQVVEMTTGNWIWSSRFQKGRLTWPQKYRQKFCGFSITVLWFEVEKRWTNHINIHYLIQFVDTRVGTIFLSITSFQLHQIQPDHSAPGLELASRSCPGAATKPWWTLQQKAWYCNNWSVRTLHNLAFVTEMRLDS